MEYQSYPKYKRSRIDWLHEIPEHWDETVISALFEDNKHKNKGSVEQNLLSLSYGRIINKDINTEEGLLPASFETYQIVNPDYIVLRLTDLQNDQRSLRVGHVCEKGIITSAYTGLKKKSFRISSARYFYYLLHAYDLLKVFYGMGAGVRQSLGFDELKKIRLLLPSDEEQEHIVQFLDRETTRIDALIEKKQRLIELLKEKRQAVITQAVTKGLDPNVPMKDSGVEWLGEVPEHWKVVRVKHVTSFCTSGSRGWGDFISDEGEIFLQSGDLTDEMGVNFDSAPRVELPIGAEGIRTRVDSGDVIVCITGAKTGRVGYVENIPEVAYVNQHLALLKPITSFVSGQWLGINLTSEVGQISFQLNQYGLKEGLGLSNILNTPVVAPPIDEQQNITRYIKQTSSTIDSLIKKSLSSIDLLREHRSALITAAVTGQIDVRNLA
ncbi:MAG: restriction endonuclease subunit S [Candidatus Thiodiazotropha sp.]